MDDLVEISIVDGSEGRLELTVWDRLRICGWSVEELTGREITSVRASVRNLGSILLELKEERDVT